MSPHELSRADARRIAVRAQVLDDDRPDGVLATLRHLTLLQTDNGAGPAPNPDLVLWSRLGREYDRHELGDLVDAQRVIELDGLLRPVEDVALYRPELAAYASRDDVAGWQRSQREWVEANDAARRDVLESLRQDGPLPSAELPDTCTVPWRSSGWNNRRNLNRLLEFLARSGEIAVAGRDGRDRLWDLAERVYPDDPVLPRDEAARRRNVRRLSALGIARARATATVTEPDDVDDAGESAVVEGVRGRWRVDPVQLAALSTPFAGRVAVLSPLDRLIFDRKRMAELFAFDYQLEMYKPVAKRRWGYFALPVLDGDQLVGKIDATADRERGALRVDAVHRDAGFTADTAAGVRRELADLAGWLNLHLDVR